MVSVCLFVCLFVSFRFVHPNRSNIVLTRYDFGFGRSENRQVTDDQRRVGPRGPI